MYITFIRHGKTLANEKRLYCGTTDLSLSDLGKKELVMLKDKTNYPNAELFITSNLKRTHETLELIYGKNNYIKSIFLNEISFGDYEMHSYEELKNKEEYVYWLEDVYEKACPNGETGKEFNKRIVKAFEEFFLLARNKKYNNIVFVLHGGVITYLMKYLFPDKKNFYEWQPECGKGYIVKFNNEEVIHYKKL